MSVAQKRKVFEKLKDSFQREVIPQLEDVEFYPAPFTAMRPGPIGKDYWFAFVSLQEPQILDLLNCFINFDDLAIKPTYNRIRLEQPVEDFSEFEGKSRLEPVGKHFYSTEVTLLRWTNFLFLKTPHSFAAKLHKSESKTEKSIDQAITYLCNELEHFDIIRAEWDEQNTPLIAKVVE